MSEFVLDSSAVIALLREERADFDLRDIVPGSWISTVNFAEVVDRFARDGNGEDAIADMLAELDLAIVPTTAALAWRAGMLKQPGRSFGLSLGDCFCLALAEEKAMPLVTTDNELAQAATLFNMPVRLARATRWPGFTGFKG